MTAERHPSAFTNVTLYSAAIFILIGIFRKISSKEEVSARIFMRISLKVVIRISNQEPVSARIFTKISLKYS